MRAGVIGLGQIGSGVALCLAREGLLAGVFDVRSDAAEQLEAVPAMAGSPAEVAAACDVVIVSVVDAAQTIDVLSGPEGVLSAVGEGASIVLVATVSLEQLDRIRTLTSAAGVSLIDCGVVGGLAAAQKGLICLVGATDAELARVRPVLDGFARSVEHVGGPGMGMAAKIARNAILHLCLMAGYEGAALARAAGLDVERLARIVDSSADTVVGPLHFMTLPDPTSTSEETSRRAGLQAVMGKDIDAALELARSHDLSLPALERVRGLLPQVVGFPLEAPAGR